MLRLFLVKLTLATGSDSVRDSPQMSSHFDVFLGRLYINSALNYEGGGYSALPHPPILQTFFSKLRCFLHRVGEKLAADR